MKSTMTLHAEIKVGMSFSLALELLKDGARVQREGWNGKGMWLKVQKPDTNSKMTLPYIYMKTADNQYVPWLASQSDLMSSDWKFVEQDNEE